MPLHGTDEARALHAEAPPIDLHADPLLWSRLFGYDLLRRHEALLPRKALFGHVDVPRLREGLIGGQFFGLVSLPWLDRGLARACDVQIDLLETAIAASDGDLVLARSADDVVGAQQRGAVAALLGIEGAHALEGSLDKLAHFARRGVRYLGLAHFTRNEAATPAYGGGADASRGLSAFGKDVVARCEELGVIVDLAHLNAQGFRDVCAMATKPFVITHTGVAGVHAMWRNASDEQLRAVAKAGGVVGIIFCPRFLGRDGIDAVVAHLTHVIDVAGEDAPALGSDWDGFIVPTRGLETAEKLPDLTDALLAKFSRGVVRKILRDNALRVVRDVPAL